MAVSLPSEREFESWLRGWRLQRVGAGWAHGLIGATILVIMLVAGAALPGQRVHALVAAAMSLWCVASAWGRSGRFANGQRRGWALLAMGALLLAASTGWRLVSPPSRFAALDEVPAHLLSFGGMALLLAAAIVLRPPRREIADGSTLLLDLIVVTSTVSIAMWSLLVVPASDGRGGLSRLETLVYAHSATGSMLLMAAIILGLRLPVGRPAGVGPLLAGLAAVGLADVAWTAAHVNGWANAGSAGAFPAAAMTLLAISLGRERRRLQFAPGTPAESPAEGVAEPWRSWLALPAAALMTILVIRALFTEQHHPSDSVVALGGLIVIGLALVRQGIGLSGQRRRTLYYRRRAERDPLTNLINHRAFQERLEQELALANAGKQLLAVALVDVDHFKEVNDNLGHLAGDHVLAAIAAALERACRETDVAARYAGDEFALLLPGLELGSVATVGGRILDEVAMLAYYAGPEAERAIGVSIGVAVTRGAGRNPRQMIAAADAALYVAKRAGRNRLSAVDADAIDLRDDVEIDVRRLIGAHPAV